MTTKNDEEANHGPNITVFLAAPSRVSYNGFLVIIHYAAWCRLPLSRRVGRGCRRVRGHGLLDNFRRWGWGSVCRQRRGCCLDDALHFVSDGIGDWVEGLRQGRFDDALHRVIRWCWLGHGLRCRWERRGGCFGGGEGKRECGGRCLVGDWQGRGISHDWGRRCLCRRQCGLCWRWRRSQRCSCGCGWDRKRHSG